MSSRHWIFRVRDILEAIEKIKRYIHGMTLTEFKRNELVIDAVVRNFEIIGEASKNIPSSVQRSCPDVSWGEMKGIRDILIHEYFRVDAKILWETTKKHLPDLEQQLKELLQNTKSDG